MSLAESKKKQRIAADPQNKKWAEGILKANQRKFTYCLAWLIDKSGFGFKMLQKMGWKEGSGLGATGEGRSDHIKVVLKADAAGINPGVK